jgi:hypothetical protein
VGLGAKRVRMVMSYAEMTKMKLAFYGLCALWSQSCADRHH